MSYLIVVQLGSIARQEPGLAVQAFAQLFSPENPKAVMAQLGGFMQGAEFNTALQAMKLGQITAVQFIESCNNEFEKLFNRRLSLEEFTQAWNAMNPKKEALEAPFQQLLQLWKAGHQVVLISYTNPLDIIYLSGLLNGQMQFGGKDGKFLGQSLMGIPLVCSYQIQGAGLQLIEAASLLNKPSNPHGLFSNSADQQPKPVYLYRNIQGSQAMVPSDQEHAIDPSKVTIPCLPWDGETNLLDLVKSLDPASACAPK